MKLPLRVYEKIADCPSRAYSELIEATNEYDPWGGVSRSEGSIDPDARFTGQKLDAETGLYYYGG